MGNQQTLETLVESLVAEALEEGFLSNLKKGLKFAGKLAYLQATKGPNAVSEELIDQLDQFIKKNKESGSLIGQTILADIEEQVAEIKATKQRYRDSRGRFAKKV